MAKSVLTAIAAQIVERMASTQMPKTGKKMETAVFDLWVGAYAGLKAFADINGSEEAKKAAEFVGGYITMVISVRGFAETKLLAAKNVEG
jgi:hypothetical protein